MLPIGIAHIVVCIIREVVPKPTNESSVNSSSTIYQLQRMGGTRPARNKPLRRFDDEDGVVGDTSTRKSPQNAPQNVPLSHLEANLRARKRISHQKGRQKMIKEVIYITATCLIVATKKAKKTMSSRDGNEIDLTNTDDAESNASLSALAYPSSSSSSSSNKSDSDDDNDDDNSILELPLPSVSICLQWLLNSVPLTGSRRRVMSLDRTLANFESELSTLSHPKLSGRKWYDDGVLITHEWAWLTKTQSMGKHLPYSPLEDEGDWEALRTEVRKSKSRAGDMVMMMLATIEIPEDIVINESDDDGTNQQNSRKVRLSFD
jgi:hypothetical protein